MTMLYGSCFCRLVKFKIDTSPDTCTLSAMCHCTNCQRANACPYVWTTHWKADAVTFEQEALLDKHQVPGKPHKTKLRCRECGSPCGGFNFSTNEWTLFPVQFERDADGHIMGRDLFPPQAHQFYGTRVFNVTDGLSKWEGYPSRSTCLEEARHS